ncbi:MAG: hypothetical protein ACRBF0_25130 [Calditrichia bacterium]
MKTILDRIASQKDLHDPTLLRELVDRIRPEKAERAGEAAEHIENLIAHLKSGDGFCSALRSYIKTLFSAYDPVYLLSESGILSNTAFYSEFWSKLKHKALPRATEDREMSELFDQIFSASNDHVWIEIIPQKLWAELFDALGIYRIVQDDKSTLLPVASAIQFLSHSIAAQGMDFELTRKLPHLEQLDSPFLEQNKELTGFVDEFLKDKSMTMQGDLCAPIMGLLESCENNIYELRRKKNEFGTSLRLTIITRRLLQQIDRLKLLLKLFKESSPSEFHFKLARIGQTLIRTEKQKNSLRRLINDNVDLLAFEIVDHAAYKGGKYIARNASEYWGYLRASMLGGLIIAFFAAFKVFLASPSLPPLGQGFIYGLNYAACFVLVKICGGIIATKQPAMTSSAVVQGLDPDDDGHCDSLEDVKNLIVKVSHSQFISFVGNLICAFPVAWLLSKGYDQFFQQSLISDVKADKLLFDLRPLAGGALFYAAIAGLFLSLSGLISGYFDNKVIFSRIPQRIKAHPRLRRVNAKLLDRFAGYIEKNLGVLSGNVSLGFFLGLAGTVGFITGLPIDIRHIAFSSANLGFAIEHGNVALDSTLFLFGALCVAGIGLVNFLVSFGLTLVIAMKSRRITFGQTRELTRLLFAHFFRSPLDFFFARQSMGVKEDPVQSS